MILIIRYLLCQRVGNLTDIQKSMCDEPEILFHKGENIFKDAGILIVWIGWFDMFPCWPQIPFSENRVSEQFRSMFFRVFLEFLQIFFESTDLGLVFLLEDVRTDDLVFLEEVEEDSEQRVQGLGAFVREEISEEEREDLRKEGDFEVQVGEGEQDHHFVLVDGGRVLGLVAYQRIH